MKKRIDALKRQRRAIVLAHNYQPPEIQDLADLCGDSLELSRRAAATDAETIVFCGVRFMAETAAILSPHKTVLMPRPEAGCPMADMITPEALAARKAELGDIPVVTYVNSTAAVKALSTICCTSANALEVVESLAADRILMGPDRNLALNTAARTAKQIIPWSGCCPYHDRLSVADVADARRAHPGAVFLAHPECRPEVVALADAALSTSGMLRYAKESGKSEFVIGTEIGLLHTLAKENPGKRFYAASEKLVCPDMKMISLADVRGCLER
ncbi:MAG: quinolinate synthase NadA, partial [Desulfobacteraceae bacterium]|nr:quinolinate synthase NadA [Desulfobacteraceae bacterium]